MSILIKGMEMPEDCIKCPVCVFENSNWICRARHDVADFGGTCRPPKCPLVEVPTPHGRLIDADALEDDDADVHEDITCCGYVEDTVWGYSREKINSAPTIIPAEEGE